METGEPGESSKYPAKYIHGTARIDERKYRVTIGHGSVVHPLVTIKAKTGPIVIGDYCIIEDECLIRNDLPPRPDGTPATLQIGNYCVFGSRSEILAARVGSHVRVQPYGQLGSGCSVGDGTVISAGSVVPSEILVPNATVVYTDDSLWRIRQVDTDREESEIIHISRWMRKNLS